MNQIHTKETRVSPKWAAFGDVAGVASLPLALLAAFVWVVGRSTRGRAFILFSIACLWVSYFLAMAGSRWSFGPGRSVARFVIVSVPLSFLFGALCLPSVQQRHS